MEALNLKEQSIHKHHKLMKTMAMDDDILLFHILPRLPARSIGRFMCVCKQWHSFLATPVFTMMHLHHVNNNQNDHKLLVVPTVKPFKYFCTIDCETLEVGLSANRSLPFEVGRNKMSIISSLNGLVCVGIEPPGFCGGYWYLDIILWNPLTGDYKKMLSKGNYLTILPRRYGLYYSCCDDDYKLLLVTKSCDVYIYSWKSDSWRKAKSRVDFSPLKVWKNGCLVKEKLYFLAQDVTNGSCSKWSSLIIRFDTKTERFTQITPPSWEDVLLCYSMMVVRGCIHLCVMLKRNSDRLECRLTGF